MKTVILAEKPSVAIQIANALNTGDLIQHDGYIQIEYNDVESFVTWAYGHLLSLKNAKEYNPIYVSWKNIPLPFFPPKYEITVKKTIKNGKKICDEGAKKQLHIIKKLFENADEIVNATDYDREGELIFAYIYEYCQCSKPYKKAKINSNVKKDIIKAFSELESSTNLQGMANAGKARAVADWIVGSNLSVFSTLNFGNKQLVSIGRVQTPTLNIIVNRELEISDFKTEDIYNIDAVFTTAKGELLKTKLDIDSIKNKDVATNLLDSLKDENGKIEEIKTEIVKKAVPLLYNTSNLQIDANNKYSYTLEKTASICQFLYENGFITYPRTSSCYLTQGAEKDVINIIENLFDLQIYSEHKNMNFTVAKRFFDNNKVDAHGAIIPTSKLPGSLTEEQKNIYYLISNSLMHIIFESAELNNTTIVVDVDGNKFKATSKTILKKGWYSVSPPNEVETLPDVKEGELLTGVYTLSEGKTKPPERYTDASLLKALKAAGKKCSDEELKNILNNTKDQGIGTEATRQTIVPSLVEKDYVLRNKKYIVPTKKGIELIKSLPFEELKSPDITAKWEMRLADISSNKEDYLQYIKDIEKTVAKWIEVAKGKEYVAIDTEKTCYVCPVCNSELREGQKKYYCSSYKKDGSGCSFAFYKEIAGKKIPNKEIEKLLKKGKTCKIKGFLSRAGKEFDAILYFDESYNIKFKF